MIPGIITGLGTDLSKETLGDLPDLRSQCEQHEVQYVSGVVLFRRACRQLERTWPPGQKHSHRQT